MLYLLQVQDMMSSWVEKWAFSTSGGMLVDENENAQQTYVTASKSVDFVVLLLVKVDNPIGRYIDEFKPGSLHHKLRLIA